MNELFALIRQFIQGLRLWIIITPWQGAVRVRFGRWITEKGPGMYFCIPLFDLWYVQSVRPRIASFGRQTVESSDGKSITITGGVQYAIGSVARLYQTLDHAEDTLMQVGRRHVAAYISTHPASACVPLAIEDGVSGTLGAELDNYGLTHVRMCVNDCMSSPVLRLVDNGAWGNCDGILRTNVAVGQ